MVITTFSAFFLGILLEILLLWESSRLQRMSAESRVIAGTFLTPEKLVMAAVTVLTAAFIGVCMLFGWDDALVYIDSPLIFVAFVLLGLGVLYYGVADPRLLPRINEEVALSVHIVVALSLLLTRPVEVSVWVYVLGLGLPWVGLLAATLPQKPPPALAKAFIYLWYLINLLALTLQTDFSAINAPPSEVTLSLFEAFVLGAGGVFLLLHSLFLIRFALMTSSLIGARSRQYMRLGIPKLYSDEQLPLLRLLLLQGLAVVLLILNARYGLAPDLSAVTVIVMAFAQGLPALHDGAASAIDAGHSL